MECTIALIPGDGIGPEIVREARKILDKICGKYGHTFQYTELLMGGASIDVHGVPLTDETIEKAKASDAVLMGSIGGNAATSPWYKLEPDKRPEAGLLKLRKSLNLFANLRPAYLYDELREACPLRDEIIGNGFDMMIMRELTGGLYFGARKTEEVDGLVTATDTLTYNENEIRRIARRGFAIAMKRRKKEANFDEVLFSLGQEVIQVLIRRGASLEDAQDAVSQTYTTIFSILPEITSENLRPWFFRVTFNYYITMYRKKKRERTFVANSHPVQSIEKMEGQELLLLIDSLKDEEQELLLLKYYYQLSYAEIALILELSVENVRKKLYRTRQKLKKELEE